MGLLDDAIREHLELKRRTGADPEEVARQEQEALGARRRVPELAERRRGPPARDEPDEARVDGRRADDEPATRRSRRPSRVARRAEPRAASPARITLEPGDGRSRRRRRPRRGPSPTASPSEPPAAEAPQARARTRTCWRRRPTSSRRRRSTTGSGSSRSRRATSTSEADSRAHGARADLARRLHRPAAGRQRARGRPRRRRRSPTRRCSRSRARRGCRRPRSSRPHRGRRRLPQPDLDDAAARCRSPAIRRSAPRWPSRGRAASARVTYVQQTGSRAAADRRRARRRRAPRASMLQEPATFGARARPGRRCSARSASTAPTAHPELPPQIVSTGLTAGDRAGARGGGARPRRARPGRAAVAARGPDAIVRVPGRHRRRTARPRRRAASSSTAVGRRGPGHGLGRRAADGLRARADRASRASRSTRASRWAARAASSARPASACAWRATRSSCSRRPSTL